LLEARAQAESAKLFALRDAATQGFAAIERGEYLALESSQAIENFVHQASLKAKTAATGLSQSV
jgi:hypothetical protein